MTDTCLSPRSGGAGMSVAASSLDSSPCASPLSSSSSALLSPTSAQQQAAQACAPGQPQENIMVCFRVRPLNKRERASDDSVAWEIDTEAHEMTRKAPARPQQAQRGGISHNGTSRATASSADAAQLTFPCSTLFDAEASTAQLYDCKVSSIVSSAMHGVNGSVLVYGQTSSGKTHTMKGNANCLGIIPLAMQHVFQHVRDTKDHEFLLRMSYIEIYNEHVKDLLNPSSGDLPIHESRARGIHVASVEKIVRCESEVLALLESGEKNRHYGRTDMNDLSSRSHTILRLMIESNPKNDEAAAAADKEVASFVMTSPQKAKRNAMSAKARKPKVKVSLLNFVDLAGSERLAQTNARVGGTIQKEGAFINKSLMFLGVIISRLSERDALAAAGANVNMDKHVPYRDSKLTRLLQSSLGGNARTSIICTVSPSASNVEQTISTLRFGARAIQVQNHATVNEIALEAALINQEKIKEAAEQERLSMNMQQEQEEQEKENELLSEQAMREAQVAEEMAQLQAKIDGLQNFIRTPAASGNAGPASSPERRRHTTGNTSRPFGSSPSSGGNGGVSNSEDFRSEQLESALAKISNLETLLQELSEENSELTTYQNDMLARCELLVGDVESLQGKVDLYERGVGLGEITDVEQLAAMERTQQEALARTQKAMYFAHFTSYAKENGLRVPAVEELEPAEAEEEQEDQGEEEQQDEDAADEEEEDEAAEEDEAEEEEADENAVMLAQMQEELEASRAAQKALEAKLEAANALAEERARQQAEAAEAEQAKYAAAAAQHAAQLSKLQDTCATLSSQAHRYAKEILQLRSGSDGVVSATPSPINTPFTPIPRAGSMDVALSAAFPLITHTQPSVPAQTSVPPIVLSAPVAPAPMQPIPSPSSSSPASSGVLVTPLAALLSASTRPLSELMLQSAGVRSATMPLPASKDASGELHVPTPKRSRLTNIIMSGRTKPSEMM